MENKNIPEIRFNGFTSAWEQHKLGGVGIITAGGDIDKNKISENNIYPVLANALTDSGIVGYYSDYKIKAPAVTITGRGDVGHAKSRHTNFTPVVRLLTLQPNNNFDTDFLEPAINNLNIFIESTGVPQLTSPQLSEYKIFSPTLPEQTAIGSFFRTLDESIELNKRKLIKLKQLKKAYLQLMFPQSGETVPKLRFHGFSGEWRLRKLGDVVEKLKSYPLSREVETEEVTGYRYIHYGDIHKQVADLITQDEQLPYIKIGDYTPLNKGDLILADASEDYTGIAEPSVILHEPKDKIIAGLHTIAMRPQNTSPLYLYYLLHTKKFKVFGSQVGAGLKVFGISFNNLSTFQTSVPTLEEQIAIGNFFRNLDEQITAQTQKLHQIKQLKSAYLQKMFI